MAYLTGSYTDEADALATFIAWGVTNGWTNNSPTSGEQLAKTINGLSCHFNFDDYITGTPWGHEAVTNAILVTGSTGFDGGEDWMNQPGTTKSTYTGFTSTGGVVDKLKASGGNYHFFATATTLSAMYETDATWGEWRGLVIGNVGGTIGYIASGGDENDDISIFDRRSMFMGDVTQVAGQCSFYDGSGWITRSTNTFGTNDYSTYALIDADGGTSEALIGSLCGPLVSFTPDKFRGNVVLAPSQITYVKEIDGEVWPIGEVEGLKFLNMTNIGDGEEVLHDPSGANEAYVCFRNYTPYTPGMAFLK